MTSSHARSQSYPIHPLIAKLDRLQPLAEDAKQGLIASLSPPIAIARGQPIIVAGTPNGNSTVVLSGVVFCHHDIEDARRQIVSLHYQGDIVDLPALLLGCLNNGATAVTACMIGHISHTSLYELCQQFPSLKIALWRHTLIDAAIAQAWMVNVGRRDAVERLAHFICEQCVRIRAAGMTSETSSIMLPLTQHHISEATGLSLVHTNKRLRVLREKRLIRSDPAHLTVLSWNGLAEIANFDADYLHLRA